MKGLGPLLLYRCAAAAAALLIAADGAHASALIREGDAWRLFPGQSEPPANWTAITFPEGTWFGPSPSGFGYGDGDDATLLTNMPASFVSVYTRRRFEVPDTNAITRLTLAVDYDDGFVAHLNGKEVARRMMPAGAVVYTTTAAGSHEASRSGQNEYAPDLGQYEKEFIPLSPADLVAGTNVLAVSGHNASPTSSDFSLIVELYANVTLVRGPLLQIQHNGQITVTWRTDALTDSAVDYGLDATVAGGTVTDTNLVLQHAVELPVLPAGSNIHYRVRSGGSELAASTFRSPPGPGQAFRFAVIGDFGSTTINTRQVADQLAAANPDLVITVGDNVYQAGQPGSFDEQWFEPYSNSLPHVPMMPVLGNHDVKTGTGIWTRTYFFLPTNGPAGLEEYNYSFDYGNAHFVGIDGNPFDLNDTPTLLAIKTWLSNDLAQTTQPWKFVYYHQPPYTSQGVHGDSPGVQQHVSPLLEQFGVQFAFQGHNHFYEHVNPIHGVNYITSGGGGKSLYPIPTPRDFSFTSVTDLYTGVLVDVDGQHLRLRCVDQTGAERDNFSFDLDHPFVMDGVIDDTNWVRAANGLALAAAIRGNTLYLATQDAGEGSDHFVYVNNVLTNSRAANWSKSGQVMEWSVFLSDENGGFGGGGGFHGWFNTQQRVTDPAIYRSVTPGLNDNAPYQNGVLEGTLHLTNHFGAFPTRLYLAGTAFADADAGALVVQVPAGDGNGNVESNEFLSVDPRDLALDLPVAEAGTSPSVEAGMWVNLDGSGSAAPSGLPLRLAWSQAGGPVGAFRNADAAVAGFRLTNGIAAATNVVLQLTVNDTRFDSDDTLSVTVTPMQDRDADGLSDAEEQTGADNLLTPADPMGHITLPLDPDSDHDGLRDGEEALAGTNPNDAGSVLAIHGIAPSAGRELVIQWASEEGRHYTLQQGTNLLERLAPMASNIAATAPMNVQTVPVANARGFYRIDVDP